MENLVFFRFLEGLNYFLALEKKDIEFTYVFTGNPSVKHLIEALRIPHTEVGRIIVNGEDVNLQYLVQDHDRITVYPVGFDAGSDSQGFSRGNGIGTPKFLLDNHLGKLAKYLRMLGFDVLYRNDYQDEELAEVASRENRILLTRDRGLLMRRVITSGYCLRSLNPKEQVIEVVRRFGLSNELQPFRRCLSCNCPLESVEKEAVMDRLEPLTKLYYDEFHLCPACNQVYWKGSHYKRMTEFLVKKILYNPVQE